MNFFEFNNRNLKITDSSDEIADNGYKFKKLNNVESFGDISNVEIHFKDVEYMYRRYRADLKEWLIMFNIKFIEKDGIIIKCFQRSHNTDNTDSAWIHHLDVPLTEIIQVEGIQVTEVDFCHFYPDSEVVLVILRSSQATHAVRIDSRLNIITDNIFFPISCIFLHTDATIDLIVSSENTSLLLFDQSASPKNPYCPSVADLQSVLSLRLISGVNSLTSFWMTELMYIQKYITRPPLSFLHNGISVMHYLSFLHIHQTVLLNVIASYCSNERSQHSSSNSFLEHLTNKINDYMNEAVNALIPWICLSSDSMVCPGIIKDMFDMLCDYSRIFRDLVLNSRSTLSVYQRLAVNKYVKKTTIEEKLASDYDGETLHLKDNEIVFECLKERRLATLKVYSKEYLGRGFSEEDILRQSENVILAHVQTYDWVGLQDLVADLGHKPMETLTLLCNHTNVKGIRDYLYNQLDLGQHDDGYKSAKDLVDRVEEVFHVNCTEVVNTSFNRLLCGNHTTQPSKEHIRSFVDRLDKSKSRSLREVLVRATANIKPGPTYELINVNLDLFLDLLKQQKISEDNGSWREDAELCMIDGEYRRLLLGTMKGQPMDKGSFDTWLYKWKTNIPVFVRYLTESCNVDLIKAVIDVDFASDHSFEESMIDQLIGILSDTDNLLYTDIDNHIAQEVMTHILLSYPQPLITRLEHRFSTNLAKGKDILLTISKTLPVHLLCKNQCCMLRRRSIKESKLLHQVKKLHTEDVISTSTDSEFPIVLYYLLRDSSSSKQEYNFTNNSTRKTILLHSAILNKSPVDTFCCMISRDITIGNDAGLTLVDLDEAAYAALLCGISYTDIFDSTDPVISSIRKTLSDRNYWDTLNKRLLRPPGYDKTEDIEQYYEVNMYEFLYRSGTPLALEHIFFNQARNPFSKVKSGESQLPLTIPFTKKHNVLEEQKDSLDYIYYLSLGRPFQAFYSIEKECSVAGKQGCIPVDIMNEIVKNIYHMALSNVDDQLIIGGCFALLRLIRSSTELLTCYLTLLRWVIEWHVQVNDQLDLSGSTQSQQVTSDLYRHYSDKTMALFKFCLSTNSAERKNSRRLIIRQLEEIFIWRLHNEYYTEIREMLSAWSLVLYFCQLHGAPSSAVILQYFAKKDQWLLFLCIAEVFGYSKDQVKEALNQFEDSSIRQHMSYIINKVDDFANRTRSSIEIEDFSRNEQATSDPLKILNKSVSISSTSAGVYFQEGSRVDSIPKKDQKSHKKYLLSALTNSAKNSLFELIFDCQLELNVKYESIENKSTTIRLNIRKLLAYSLALGHPFLSVLAYSADLSKDDLLESSRVNKFMVYINCLSCFIISSAPSTIQEGFWSKWGGEAKLDWSEDELIDLIGFAIENKFVNTVADAFAVLKDEKFVFIGSFYSMILHSAECFNPVLRDLFLVNFVNECTSLCMSDSTLLMSKDRRRTKTAKNAMLFFLNKLLGLSLTTALHITGKTLGVQVLQGWLLSLSNSTTGLLQSYVKTLFPFLDTNILLLSNLLTIYLEFYDLVDCQFQSVVFPVNTRSREFIQFIEDFINNVLDKLSSADDYTRQSLARNALSIVEQVNGLHSIQLPMNRDQWKDNEAKLKSMSLGLVDFSLVSRESLVDLISFALAGQADKLETLSLVPLDENKYVENNTSLHGIQRNTHGSSDCWKRLVIPEEWQDKILTLPNFTSEDNLELVNQVNVMLNGKKWIEACSYMIEHGFSVKDAVLILTSMKVACGKVDPTKLPTFIRDYCKSQQIEMIVKETVNRLPVRRMSIIMNSTVSKLNLMMLSENELNGNKNQRQSRLIDTCQHFLTKVTEILIYGQELVEYICTIYCVANKMAESYISVAKGEEFDVLTKILVGTCRDKIDTADMYLGVVDIDPEKLCHFIAEVIVHVLRLEIQTYIGSTSIISSTSYKHSTSISPNKSKDGAATPTFSLSPRDNTSFQSCISNGQNSGSRRSGLGIASHASVLSLHENTLKVAERCQLRSEWATVPTIKTKKESRLIKAFTLQDILLLNPNSRKLGKILFSYYQKFSQEVFSCIEDAEFLVHLLIQCHNSFTEGGDTIGISNCLKVAKELTRLLNNNGYFVLMAQLLCRIGRYGEMPYIFSNLIENHEFEQLFRKDMDKEGVIVPYIFDYLNRYHKDDYEKVELVCVKYNCYYELAETKIKMATSAILKLKSHLGHKSIKDYGKLLTSSIINSFLEASKSYLKAGCYKKMEESFRKAQFYKLQQKWLEDPEKTFTVGSMNKTGKTLTKVAILPETGLPYGVRIIDLNKEQALVFLKKISNFYTAFIMWDQLRLSPDIWIELLVHHVFINADEVYLRHYVFYFGPGLSSNFIQQILNRLERSSFKLHSSKQSVHNLKVMLSHCGDVFFVKRMSEAYKVLN